MIEFRINQRATFSLCAELRLSILMGVCLWLGALQATGFQERSALPILPSSESKVDPFPLDLSGMERELQNVPFSLTTATISPFSKVRLGRMFSIRCRVVNEQSERDTVTLVANLVGQPGEQFARKVTMDGGTSKTFDLPLLLSDRYRGDTVEVSCTLWVERDGRPVLIQRDGEAIEQKIRLSVEKEVCITATLLNKPPRQILEWEWPNHSSYPSYDWLVATRTGAGYQRVTMDLESTALPSELVDWDTIDNVVIADNRIFQNYAALRTLKSWLMSGGRAWIMLDHVDPQQIRPLLLAGQYVNTIDRTEVTDVVLDSPLANNPGGRNFRFQSQQGVKLIKVEQSGGEVTHTVDSWPAAIWMPIGDGELLLTTLGPTAWLQPTDKSAKSVEPPRRRSQQQGAEGDRPLQVEESRRMYKSDYELYQSDYELRPWVGPLGDRFHQARIRPMPKSPGLEYPVAQFGFQVISRGTVALALIAFCVTLGVVGYGLRRSDRSEWIGWVAPVISLVVGCGLSVGAGALRRDVPEGWHRIQTVYADGKASAFVYEQSAMYRSQPSAFPLMIKADAIIDPELDVAVRDFRSTQSNLEDTMITSEGWPTGIWRMESQIAVNEDVGAAIGIWSPKGLVVQLPDNLSNLDSLLISQPSAPRSALSKSNPNNWIVAESDTLPPREFAVATGLVDERFFRRAEVLAGIFDPTGGEARPKSLHVMGWGKLAAAQVSWDENGSENSGQGEAIWKLPLVRLAPKLNTQIAIPPALIRWSNASTEGGVGGAFVRSKGEWTGPFTNPMSTAVKPQLPEEIFPFRSSKVRFALRVRAAGRDVTIYVRTKNGTKEIAKYFSPQQVLRIEVNDPEILKGIDLQELDVVVEVSDLVEKKEDAEGQGFVQAVPWQIEYLWMTVEGIANYQEKQ